MQLLADGNGRHVHALCRKHGTGEQAICTVVSRADKHADPYVMRVKGSVFYDLQDLVRRGACRHAHERHALRQQGLLHGTHIGHTVGGGGQ